jgi:hypothetical protein
MDKNSQVVFFTPRGKVLPGAPPAHAVRREPPVRKETGEPEDREEPGPGPEDRGESGTELGPEPELELFTGTPRYQRDSDMPWEIEARVWDALDPA